MNNRKEMYKRALKDTLKDIEKNVNDIINIAFENNTREVHIKIDIEPGDLVKWSFEEKVFTNPIQIIMKEELKEEGK